MFFTILTPPRPYTNFPREVISQIIGAGGLTRAILKSRPLFGPDGSVILAREGWLAKFGEELVEAVKWNPLGRRDLDAKRSV
jgi:hypothetical protein